MRRVEHGQFDAVQMTAVVALLHAADRATGFDGHVDVADTHAERELHAVAGRAERRVGQQRDTFGADVLQQGKVARLTRTDRYDQPGGHALRTAQHLAADLRRRGEHGVIERQPLHTLHRTDEVVNVFAGECPEFEPLAGV